ncbi:hypothetical protein P691DRAFT_767623 [Macrolepiota fuliginosa MF-IS2]|uniref:Uncharacterized protein n=1 Tax=Macrolepiota fuliginosa MF-IS2 TaxID=1400762 RepID=A0A9P5WWY0_9AGAR|nr:hypothetical protein P691DRAFT_767623 [Macrolepiota fuliginosa MF-IS2]
MSIVQLHKILKEYIKLIWVASDIKTSGDVTQYPSLNPDAMRLNDLTKILTVLYKSEGVLGFVRSSESLNSDLLPENTPENQSTTPTELVAPDVTISTPTISPGLPEEDPYDPVPPRDAQPPEPVKKRKRTKSQNVPGPVRALARTPKPWLPVGVLVPEDYVPPPRKRVGEMYEYKIIFTSLK